MIYCRPAGLSDEDDSDEFEFSTDSPSLYNSKNGIIVEEKPESKESLFYRALKDGDLDTLKTMLTNGFHVDQPLDGGWSPLMHACSLGLFPIVEFFIGAQANVNFNNELFTPLMALCKSKSMNEGELLKCLNALFNCGVNINATDRNACTALMYACSASHIDLVRKLVECECDVNIQDSEGWSALFYAVNGGQEDIIQVLVKGKARLDLIDKRRRSAFELAMQKGYEHLGKLVCSKKEKRRLLEEEKDLPTPQNISKDPVEELLMQLPTTNAKSISGFSSDVCKLLWSMGLGHFCVQFATNNVQLNEFLLINDEQLKALGVRFSVHRQHILNSVRMFHLHQWNKASLGMKPRNQQLSIVDAVRLMCNITKHLHILTATMNYECVYQPIPIRSEVFIMCESAVHQLKLITGELKAIHSFASCLKHKEDIEPVDLIKPKRKSQNYFFPILTTTVLFCFLMWKKKISISLSRLLFYDGCKINSS